MNVQDFLEGIRPELEALPTPAPTAELKARILASRAAGVRTILPAPSEPRRFPARLAIGSAIVAVLALLIVHSQAEEVFASPGVFGEVALAQGARAAFDPMRLTAPERLRPLSLEFERRARDSASSHIFLHLARVADAWRLTSVDRRPASVAVETLFVSRQAVTLLHRAIHVSPYSRYQRINVWQDYRAADSVSGRMNTEAPSIGAGRSFARRLERGTGPYVTEAFFPFLFMATPLSRDWSGSASFMGWAVRDDDVFYPIDLQVEGEEQVTVPAGRFDCWRLSLRFAGRRFDYWVRKTDGLGVRLQDPTREIVLTRISP